MFQKAFISLKQYVFVTSSFTNKSHELTDFIGNEMTGLGDKTCGQSQYRFSERAKRVRERERETFFRVLSGIDSVPWQNVYPL
jgi:hypothetical protein